jgi:hypothetical protein
MNVRTFKGDELPLLEGHTTPGCINKHLNAPLRKADRGVATFIIAGRSGAVFGELERPDTDILQVAPSPIHHGEPLV